MPSWLPLLGILGLLSGLLFSCKSASDSEMTEALSTSRGKDELQENNYCATLGKNQPVAEPGQTPNHYIIFSVYLVNPLKYLQYFARAYPMVVKHQGRMVIRGLNFFNVLEGHAPFQAFNVVEFPNLKSFNDFYCSEEYLAIRQIRLNSTKNHYAVLKKGDGTSIGINSSSSATGKKGFILFNDLILDKQTFERYLIDATSLAAKYGGVRLFSGTDHIELEGRESEKPQNLTAFSFPSFAKLREWYQSDAYKSLKTVRLKATKVVTVLAMDGFVP